MWIPDVYQGTSTVATLLIAAGPKLAAFALAFRLLGEALMSVSQTGTRCSSCSRSLSLGLGNIVAIAQTNLKRMLAYSTISQIGFVLLGMIGAHTGGDAGQSADAFGASMFYAITYVLTTLGTFGLIQFLARKGFEAENVDDFKGLAQAQPLAGRRHDDDDVLAGGPAAAGRLLREAGGARVGDRRSAWSGLPSMRC